MALLFTRVHLRRFFRDDFAAAGFWINDTHIVPVIGKFFAAAQADKIRPGDGRDSGAGLAFTASDKRRASFMTATEDPGPGQFK